MVISQAHLQDSSALFGDKNWIWMSQLQVKSLLLADETSQIIDSCDDLLSYDIVMLSGYYASYTSMLRNILFLRLS